MDVVNLNEIIPKNAIVIGSKAETKKDVIKELVKLSKKAFKVRASADKIAKQVLEREKKGSTAIGNGVAIPHTKFSGLKSTIGAFIKTKKAVKDYVGIDGSPVTMFFLVLSGEDKTMEYTDTLRTIMKLVADKDKAFNFLKQAKTSKDVIEIFDEISGVHQA